MRTPRPLLRRSGDAVYWLGLAAWVAVLVTAAVSATAVFTVLPTLDPTLPGYDAYDATAHGIIAGGHVMETIFTFVDVAQVVAIILVVAMYVVQHLWGGVAFRRTSNIARTAFLALAIGLFVGRAMLLTPEMNRSLRAFWHAAESGDVEDADRHRAAFDERHPIASRLYGGTLLAVLGVVLVSPAALERSNAARSLPTPALAERRR